GLRRAMLAGGDQRQRGDSSQRAGEKSCENGKAAVHENLQLGGRLLEQPAAASISRNARNCFGIETKRACASEGNVTPRRRASSEVVSIRRRARGRSFSASSGSRDPAWRP